MRRWLFAGLLFCFSTPAWAGAWTLDEGHWQVISGAVVSEADRTFGTTAPITFRRQLFQTYTEYGIRQGITLFATTETANVAVAQNGGAPFQAIDNAAEAGVRVRLDDRLGLEDWGMISMETSFRVAGAFNFAVSANRSTGGNGAQLRLLYGRSFKLDGRDGFVDVQLGEVFMTGARPDETPLDITTGLWLGADHLVMAQSFNLFAAAGPIAAYPAFNSHKLELSWVYRWSPRWLFQAGAFFSPAGNNALVEQGLAFSVWRRF
jgi:hypothetical protein